MNIKAAISNKPWILAIIVFALLAVWMGSGMFESPEFKDEASQVQAASNTGGPVSVQVETLIAEPVARVVSVYGRTAPARQVEIAAETEGRVEIINAHAAVGGHHMSTSIAGANQGIRRVHDLFDQDAVVP
jgi:multidrug efflux system membrane fusion protein